MKRLDALVDEWQALGRTPEVHAERCVHASVQVATCSACVEACPQNAWSLDAAGLNLDTAACDGCGLCASACPEAALSMPEAMGERQIPLREDPDNGLTAEIRCRAVSGADRGALPCAHALGVREVLGLYHYGVRCLDVRHGDCDQCPRGTSPMRLDTVVSPLNRALSDRGHPNLVFRRVGPGHASVGHAERPSRRVSRRGFLRGAVAEAVTYTVQPLRLGASGPDSPPRSAGERLPRRSPGDRLPSVPRIDEARCIGCDACTRLCPHGALVREQASEGPAYGVYPEHCTGCGVCIDVCDAGAVTVDRWAIPGAAHVALEKHQCRACGAPYHLPSSQALNDWLCPICARVNHYQNLFQVQP